MRKRGNCHPPRNAFSENQGPLVGVDTRNQKHRLGHHDPDFSFDVVESIGAISGVSQLVGTCGKLHFIVASSPS